MAITSTDVRRLLAADPDATLVLIQGHTAVITAQQADSADYRGALAVITRAELLERTGGTDLSEHELAEQAAILDATVSELGG